MVSADATIMVVGRGGRMAAIDNLTELVERAAVAEKVAAPRSGRNGPTSPR